MLKLKSSFAVVLVSLVFKCIIKENAAGGTSDNAESSQSSSGYEPFVVAAKIFGTSSSLSDPSAELPLDYVLPSKFIKVGNTWKLASEPMGYMFEITLCPEIKTSTKKTREILDNLYTSFPGTTRCLFQRGFNDGENRVCNGEPELSLDKRTNEKGSPVICGFYSHQQLVDAQYYNCGSERSLTQYGINAEEDLKKGAKNPRPFPQKYFRIYEICYDFIQEKTLWTRHTPMTPDLLSNPESPYKNLSNDFHLRDFSTDVSSLALPPTTFSDLKQQYEATEGSEANVIHTLVSKDHMALLYWKKATTHMINSAPLLPEFVPLMKAINNGIYLASVNLFEKSQNKLQIYSCTRDGTKPSMVKNIVSSVPIMSSVAAQYEPKTPIKISNPNIWYQFVYNESDAAGVLIVLHNTREAVPQQKECKENELMDCDFRNWSSSPESISDDISKHAYCCDVSEKQVKSLFSINELKLKKAFKIQKQINAPRTQPLEKDADKK